MALCLKKFVIHLIRGDHRIRIKPSLTEFIICIKGIRNALFYLFFCACEKSRHWCTVRLSIMSAHNKTLQTLTGNGTGTGLGLQVLEEVISCSHFEAQAWSCYPLDLNCEVFFFFLCFVAQEKRWAGLFHTWGWDTSLHTPTVLFITVFSPSDRSLRARC